MPPKKKAKLESSAVVWQYKDGKKWMSYADEDCAMLEKEYKKIPAGVSKVLVTKDLSFNKGYGSTYEFDFGKMVQTNKDSNTSRDIRRLGPEGSDDDEEEEEGATWEWMDDQGLWVAFYDEDNETIEKGYKLGSQLTTTSLSFNKGFDSTYVFDFKKMVQTNMDSKTQRKLRRTAGKLKAWKIKGYGISKGEEAPPPGASGIPYPSTWAKQKDPLLDQVPVDASSEEFKSVLASFHKTLGRKCVVHSLTRLQNYALWPFYALKKTMIEEKNKGKGGCNEKLLFHGARVKANMDAIIKFGFDMRVAANGLCGQGTYFAVNARYSDCGYVYQRPDKSKEMLLCRVLVGRYAQKKGGDRRPPPLDPKKPNGELYDSVVDNIKNPVMHVVFYDHQAIPEYLVHYT